MTRMALVALLAIVAATATSSAQSTSPYADQEQRAIKALSDDEIRDLLEARGMGLAKAAELNSYPGPLHVLQLANELGLSDAQRKATDSLYATMRQRALSIGRQIVEAERTLDRAFANGAPVRRASRISTQRTAARPPSSWGLEQCNCAYQVLVHDCEDELGVRP